MCNNDFIFRALPVPRSLFSIKPSRLSSFKEPDSCLQGLSCRAAAPSGRQLPANTSADALQSEWRETLSASVYLGNQHIIITYILLFFLMSRLLYDSLDKMACIFPSSPHRLTNEKDNTCETPRTIKYSCTFSDVLPEDILLKSMSTSETKRSFYLKFKQEDNYHFNYLISLDLQLSFIIQRPRRAVFSPFQGHLYALVR